VDNSLWDTLSIKMRKKINQVKVLKKKRSILAASLSLVGVRHGNAIAGSIGCFLGR
jgi:hypothetical protein